MMGVGATNEAKSCGCRMGIRRCPGYIENRLKREVDRGKSHVIACEASALSTCNAAAR
jgi:hypothetical protein